MLLIKTKIGASAIAGTGLFADQDIPMGTVIWRFAKGFDMRFSEQYPDTLSEPAKTFFMTYATQHQRTLNYMLCADDARFLNHADTPNTHHVEDPDDEEMMTVASRDIQKGEELTINYREIDTHPLYGFRE